MTLSTTLHGFPPKVFIIGAQKSGTTQLTHLLEQHPDICVAGSKEPDIFSRFKDRPVDSFIHEFNHPDSICIDASTSYSCACLPKYFPADAGVDSNFNGVPEYIKRISPGARFIYILRDPVIRTFSAYWHQVRSGVEKNSLESAIKQNSYYLRTSHYAGQLELYLDHFAMENFLFLNFEDLITSPEKTAQQCFRFLDLPGDIPLSLSGGQNKSFVYTQSLHRLNYLLAPVGGINRLVKSAKHLIPRKILEWGASKMTQNIPKIKDGQKMLIAEQLIDSIDQLEQMTNKKWPHWKITSPF